MNHEYVDEAGNVYPQYGKLSRHFSDDMGKQFSTTTEK